MDLLFPDQGLTWQLEKILTGGVKYHLFTNNVVPTLSTNLAGLTEAAWGGYAAITQAWADFTTNGVSGHNGFAIAAPINFANSSGSTQTAYGYYVTDTGATKLIAVALFDSPPVTVANGATLTVVPMWGDFSQLSA